MPELVIEKPLRYWVSERDARLTGKVQPATSAPHVAGPYCTMQRLAGDTWTTLGGPTEVHHAVVRLVIWGQDHQQVREIAAKVRGDKADPGLHGFSGTMIYPVTEFSFRTVTVQQAFVEDGPDLEDEPDDGSEQTWYGAVLDVDIVWEEGV